MAFFDFTYLAHGRVERLKRGFACVGKLDRREGDMIETEFLRVDGRTKADNIAFIDQSFQPCLAWCLGKTDLFESSVTGMRPSSLNTSRIRRSNWSRSSTESIFRILLAYFRAYNKIDNPLYGANEGRMQFAQMIVCAHLKQS